MISSLLYFAVGLISLSMAVKCLSSASYLPFHEQAAGKRWDEIDAGVKKVIITLLRLTGMGFLITSILLILSPAVIYFSQVSYIKFLMPAIALAFFSGLGYFNYLLNRNSGAETPWKESFYAVVLIATGMIFSIF